MVTMSTIADSMSPAWTSWCPPDALDEGTRQCRDKRHWWAAFGPQFCTGVSDASRAGAGTPVGCSLVLCSCEQECSLATMSEPNCDCCCNGRAGLLHQLLLEYTSYRLQNSDPRSGTAHTD